MAIFEDAYIQRLMDEAEYAISEQCQCIFSRFSIATIAGQAEYTLPSGIVGILQITYKGHQVIPSELRDWEFSQYLKPQNLSAQGIPRWYIRRGFGWSKLKFHPIPSESISANDSVIDTITGINERVIISTYRVSNLTTERLPEYLRRNIIKYYVMKQAYLRESKAQNLIASQLFSKSYDNFMQLFKIIIERIPQCITYQHGPTVGTFLHKPARPVLPTSGKWSI